MSKLNSQKSHGTQAAAMSNKSKAHTVSISANEGVFSVDPYNTLDTAIVAGAATTALTLG